MPVERYESLNKGGNLPEVKRKVAAYCRVSTDDGEQADSFESQLRYFRQYIERNPDWELFEIFADEGISGTNTKKRREFNRMIACAAKGDFDLIVTKEISRFARNTLDSIFYTRELKKHGVGVIFMNDNINTMDGDAELRLAIMSSIAQEESRRTSERVKWGQKRRMEEGVVFGRSMLGYDVIDGRMCVNEEGAETVRLIFRKFVSEGKGTHVIARELREEGIRPMRVKEWQNTVILRILRNEKYCGDLVQKKTYTPDFLSHEKKYNRGQEEFVILKDHHEPIISRELFEKANRILDERAKSQKGKEKHSSRYPLSGKLKCGLCGAGYVARYKMRKDGSRYRSWRCLENARHAGPHADAIGNMVGCLAACIRNEDALRIACMACRQLDIERGRLAAELMGIIDSVLFKNAAEQETTASHMLRKRRAALDELFSCGGIDTGGYKALKAKYEAEINGPSMAVRTSAEGRNELRDKIKNAVDELVSGVDYEDEFYAQLIDKMVVFGRERIDVYFKMLPVKLSFKAV